MYGKMFIYYSALAKAGSKKDGVADLESRQYIM